MESVSELTLLIRQTNNRVERTIHIPSALGRRPPKDSDRSDTAISAKTKSTSKRRDNDVGK